MLSNRLLLIAFAVAVGSLAAACSSDGESEEPSSSLGGDDDDDGDTYMSADGGLPVLPAEGDLTSNYSTGTGGASTAYLSGAVPVRVHMMRSY